MAKSDQSLKKIERLIKSGKLSSAVDRLLALYLEAPNNLSLQRMLARLANTPGQHQSKLKPNSEQLQNLMNHYESRDLESVVQISKELTSSYPFIPMLYSVMGSAFQEMRMYSKATVAYERSLTLEPDNPHVYFNIGEARARMGDKDLAIDAYQSAIRIAPDFVLARVGLGKMLVNEGERDRAEEQFRIAIKLDPDNTQSQLQLAKLHVEAEKPDSALSVLEKIKSNDEKFPLKRELLALAYHQQGRHQDCLKEYEVLLRILPNYKSRGPQIFAANYLEEISLEQHLAIAKSYGEAIKLDKSKMYSSWNCQVNPKRLRVGIVSGDFYEHVVGRMINRLIENTDALNIDFLAFSTHERQDSISRSLKRKFSDWIPLINKPFSDSNLSDAAEKIYRKAPNVLIDLSGHTKFNALPLFNYRPAPVQVSWLGYSGTTGVDGIDYKLADQYVVSEEEAQFYTENIWRLPDCFLCPIVPEDAGMVSSLPALKNNYILFGSQNRFEKINVEVIDCWSKILKSVPRSRLLLKSFGGDKFYAGRKIKEKFLKNGIDESRLIFKGRSDRAGYFDSYRKIDIALDTFPFTGGVTTTDALWMGVPVLTKCGKDTFISHQGESILHNAGFSSLIAKNREEYVEKAIAFATDLPKLEEFRKLARDSLLKSNLFNSERFARSLSNALRGMWDIYVNKNIKS